MLPTTYSKIGRLITRFCSTKTKQLATDILPHTQQLISSISKKDTSLSQLKIQIQKYWKESKIQSPLNFPNTTFLSSTTNKEAFVSTITKFYNKSFHIRNLLRWELLNNSNNNKIIQDITQQLHKNNLIPLCAFETSDQVFEWCINDAIKYNDITTLTYFCISYYSRNPTKEISKNLIKNVITASIYINPKADPIILQNIIQLDKFFKTRNFHLPISENQALILSNKAISLHEHPILTKEILHILLEERTSCSSSKGNVRAAYALIRDDYAKNNPAGIHLTWTKIKNVYNSIQNHDSRILYKILKMYSKQKSYRKQAQNLISELTPEYYVNNPLLLPAIISFASKSKNFEMATKIMTDINTHSNEMTQKFTIKSRYTLSTLLRMHLTFNDSVGVDNVLKQINRVHGELSPADYQAIIAHLVNSTNVENIKKALTMIESIPKSKVLPSISTIINKLLQSSVKKENDTRTENQRNIDNLLMLANDLDPLHKSSLWSIIASLYIKNLLETKGITTTTHNNANNSQKNNINYDNKVDELNIAIMCYQRSLNIKDDTISINPFALPHHNVLLKLTKANKLIILRNIAQKALSYRRKDVFKWCCSEMSKNGIPTKDLILEWNIILKHQIRRSSYQNDTELTTNLQKDLFKLAKN